MLTLCVIRRKEHNQKLVKWCEREKGEPSTRNRTPLLNLALCEEDEPAPCASLHESEPQWPREWCSDGSLTHMKVERRLVE